MTVANSANTYTIKYLGNCHLHNWIDFARELSIRQGCPTSFVLESLYYLDQWFLCRNQRIAGRVVLLDYGYSWRQ